MTPPDERGRARAREGEEGGGGWRDGGRERDDLYRLVIMDNLQVMDFIWCFIVN